MGHFLCQTQRVVEGQLPHHGTETEPAGGTRHSGQEDGGRSDAPYG